MAWRDCRYVQQVSMKERECGAICAKAYGCGAAVYGTASRIVVPNTGLLTYFPGCIHGEN